MAEHISKNQDVVLRGLNQQQTTRVLRTLLYEGPRYKYYPNQHDTNTKNKWEIFLLIKCGTIANNTMIQKI